eukprot:jgi/Ulvmu1/12122/UM084_0048.1
MHASTVHAGQAASVISGLPLSSGLSRGMHKYYQHTCGGRPCSERRISSCRAPMHEHAVTPARCRSRSRSGRHIHACCSAQAGALRKAWVLSKSSEQVLSKSSTQVLKSSAIQVFTAQAGSSDWVTHACVDVTRFC